jgi:Fe-S cluster biogenesis protein NfuA
MPIHPPMQTNAIQLRRSVEEQLDRLRPALIADGGNIELVDIGQDGTVQVALQGTCATCPAQAATIRIGIEAPLCNALPGVTGVVAI